MKTIEKICELNKEIDKLYKEIDKLQSKCKHKNLEKKYGSNTGNAGYTDDIYWIDYHCLNCDKVWTEEQ